MHALIVYFSHSGNTRRIAELIQNATGGTLFEIEPVLPYPADYNKVTEKARKEIREGFHPPLKNADLPLELYDTVIIGTPNWWSTIAPPIASFLTSHDVAGKKIAPFCTHGGGGGGRIVKDIEKKCPKNSILTCLEIYGNGGTEAKSQVDMWLRKIVPCCN